MPARGTSPGAWKLGPQGPVPPPAPTRRGDPSRVPEGASIRGPASARTKGCLYPRSQTSGLSSAAKTPDHFASGSSRLAWVGTAARPARPCPPRSEACVARGAQPSPLRRDLLPYAGEWVRRPRRAIHSL
ncbi:unnamed protein product [Rangifer tarandus platyrhynchus]|uniref:Uncharacterized protein n=3 Tax=Rangifer tarandus platyrhynchus TaxID=3082113 RepID=A0ACB0ETM2_RANTA|nr:unnamed protein product [Rangifer tarandus platyrhynchus]CAI9704085.1 unnamed protein product [Rangifer tarandus platyrhynchus]